MSDKCEITSFITPSTRLEKLLSLEQLLAEALTTTKDARTIAQLSKRYMDVTNEIEILQGKEEDPVLQNILSRVDDSKKLHHVKI